ncbi:MAG: lycopene cyclase domain-containing protein [Ignavibacteriales bacterium]|nr:lycopene cyclase domain-containing protein [Ignavibacteriaceae bacterium]NLH61729.1 lycopene cyclase domain-containing protein [Ignavibacteriales bacterium]HOJ19321.1 lycopene cyclase domain-containing protein [Ignavibacteriaceae bacterium]HPO55408.1 lycopene cyclase domain-containing protein [Ignavibacteriaceae bacterium]
MYTYLLINTGIILFPFLFSFEKQIRFYKQWKRVFLSIAVTGTAFIIWDIIFTMRGVWGFNPAYHTGLYIINLPLEEILFFITVPYSAMFIYEVLGVYLKERVIEFKKDTFTSVATLFFFAGLWFWRDEYTVVVLASCAIFFVVVHFNQNGIVRNMNFWKTIFIIYVPFLIVNYFLTSLPVVWYNNAENINFRVLTIPLEDFFYSFSLIAFSLFFYDRFK